MHRPLHLPDDDAQADYYLHGVQVLEAAGYRQYEISNFAKPGFEARHNSRYWDLSEYLGLGCAAHSLYGGRRFQFVSDLESYTKGLLEGAGSIVAGQEDVPGQNRCGEYVMLALRTCAGIDEQAFYTRFSIEFAPCAQVLLRYVDSGHATCGGGRYALTPKGFLVSNSIIGEVLDALEAALRAEI